MAKFAENGTSGRFFLAGVCRIKEEKTKYIKKKIAEPLRSTWNNKRCELRFGKRDGIRGIEQED